MRPDAVEAPQSRTGRAVQRALLIVNPHARRAERLQPVAARALADAGVAFEVRTTEAPGHAMALAQEFGRSCDAVFTLGGDGTAMEAITALATSGPPVGILAGGTGNVLARSLGIPLDVRRAVPALLGGRETRMDLGRVGGSGRSACHFAIGLGVGVDAAMIAGASRTFKRRLGVLAYVWSALRSGLRLATFDVALTADGTRHTWRASSVMIANLGGVLGGRIQFGHGIRADDGVLHACIYAPRHLLQALRLFAGMLTGTVHRHRAFACVPGRHFVLETTPPMMAQADGELLGTTPIEVTVEPLAARLLVPRQDTLDE